MGIIEAIILGIIQGLTEFLPVSSSGHIELGKILMEIKEENATFTIVVHGATVLSTIVIFRKDIIAICKDLFQFTWNEGTQFVTKIVLSMIPAAVFALLFEDELKSLFNGNVVLVSCMLLFTSALLAFTYYSKNKGTKVGFIDSIIIGIAQAVAILPGISRSGSTIATGLILGKDKAEVAKFSFLMVIPLIIGANAKDILDEGFSFASHEIVPLIVGFIVAFITGLLACNWMIKIVKKGKLIWFALYCAIIGFTGLILNFIF